MTSETKSRLPPIDFSTFVISMGSSVMMQLGQGPDAAETHLAMARQNVDLLVMLEEKTRGNLTEQEAKLLSDILYQARMACLEAGDKQEA
jgi:hypothetical protein